MILSRVRWKYKILLSMKTVQTENKHIGGSRPILRWVKRLRLPRTQAAESSTPVVEILM